MADSAMATTAPETDLDGPIVSKLSALGFDHRPDFDMLDLEFLLFASASIDSDRVMKMIAKLTGQDLDNARVGLERLVERIRSDAGFHDERGDLVEYVRSIDNHGRCLDETAVRDGYERFKAEKRS